ncbi:heavy metal-associated isoprenylated plant 3-like [Olea europaea subsp. europaea]|uniref:Heavy metal-associated isoprenylated plant 3-like n=2 Tax=Olea europaea subsp. europaea TaxID=158383 RepID=A0A8S0TMW3_OLEEU|nr:heavy metal-associated isoprenylated plant 3-like [Olea europaea subsp. europaea]
MATQAAAENPLRDIQNKTWILITSIHCEGCKRKVKKILSQVQGVENVEVDIKQQKVMVTGHVEGDSLIKKLKKSGKNAELWLEKTEKKKKNSGQGRNKEKQISNEPKIEENGAKKEQKPAVNVQVVQNPAKISNGGASTSSYAAKSGGVAEVDGGEVKSNEKRDAGGSAKVKGPVKTSGSDQVAKLKSEEKKPESSSAGEPLFPAEEKEDSESKSGVSSVKSNDGSVGGGVSCTTGKKKKRQGQNGDNNECAKSSVATPACTGSEKHHDAGPPPISVPANHIPPRQHDYHDYPHTIHPYGPPPVYAMSYNTAYPASSYTASYYAAPPPRSYAYSYPGQEIEPPPPSNSDSYPQQPLDSFEMFSDENPNGCFIM